MKTPITPSDLRIGDKVRTEAREGRPFGTHPQMLASEWIVGEDDLDGDYEGVDLYLLERGPVVVDLPTEPTLGWATGLTKNRQPVVNAFGSWMNPSDLLNRTTWTYGDERGDLHLPARTVTSFVEAVPVPKAALETLDADLYNSYPDMAGSVERFLAAIDAANGDPR